MNYSQLQMIYKKLSHFEQIDIVTSANYRQQIQNVLANPEISLLWRQLIADRLNQVNLLLGMTATKDGDSY